MESTNGKSTNEEVIETTFGAQPVVDIVTSDGKCVECQFEEAGKHSQACSQYVPPEPPIEICGKCNKPKKSEIEKERCHCGRPVEYSFAMVEKAIEYIESCEDVEDEFHKTRGEKSDGYERIIKVELPSIEGLAVFLKVAVSTIYVWKDEYEEFSEVIDQLKAKQAKYLINNGLSGDYNPTISKVLLTKHGYREGIDATSNGKDLIPVDEEIKNKADAAVKAFLDGKKTD